LTRVPAAAGCDFLHVRHRLLKESVMRRDDDDGHVFIDQGDRAVLQFARGVAFGMDIGDFLELQRAFHGQRIACAAAEIEHVLAFRQLARQALHGRLDTVQDLAHDARHFGKAADESRFLGLRHGSAGTTGADLQRRNIGEKTG
jgi:hypothetical protein